MPRKGSCAFQGTGCGSGGTASSGCLTPSEKPAATPSVGSRPPAPGAAEKRFLGVQGIRLDQHPFQIQLAEELPQHGPIMVFAGGVAGLTNRYAQGYRVQRHLGNVDAVCRRPYADPAPEVGSKEPRSDLPSQISCSRSAAPPGILAMVQSRIAVQRAATSTCWKK